MTSRNKQIVAMENRLNQLVETDIRNPEIYKILKQLAYIYVNQNKYIYGYQDIDALCHDVASDVWMSVIGGKRIGAWIFYIGKMIKVSYVQNQRKIEHEVIDSSDDIYLQDSIKRMCASSSMSSIKEFDDMQRSLIFDNIYIIILECMDNIKYKKGSIEWLQIYTNVCINLLNDIDGKNTNGSEQMIILNHMQKQLFVSSRKNS